MKKTLSITVATMNKIIDARRINHAEISAKGFEVLIPEGADERQAVVVPPLKEYSSAHFEGIRIVFENALLPFD